MSALAFEHSTEESNNERPVIIKLILGKLIKNINAMIHGVASDGLFEQTKVLFTLLQKLGCA